MRKLDHLQTMALTYQEIVQGERPWTALGNFMNDWFEYAKDKRAQLVKDPIVLPEKVSNDIYYWATFCVASVEWFCDRYNIERPLWIYSTTYSLSEPQFDFPCSDAPDVRAALIQETPEQFSRRNIYCGNRMFANKYEFAEEYRRLFPRTPTPTL